MGKKGKKAKKKASTNTATAVCNDEECIDTTPTPKHGWVYEMNQAAASVSTITKSKSIGAGSNNSERNIVRLARAYHKLRLWEKLDKLVSTTLEELPRDDVFDDVTNYNLLMGWHKEATDILSRESVCDRVEFDTIGGDLDTCITGDDPAYRNINILHSSVLQGDVRLLEEVVARGAAIDFPVGAKTKGATFREGTEEAPRGATALLLGCMLLSMHGSMPSNISSLMQRSDPRLARVLEGALECVVQLVKLGANCHVVLNLDDDNDSGERGSSERSSERRLMKSLGLHNKTAYELAALSKKEELIRTMEEFRSISEQITIVHCRCGSRLPWKDCHGNDYYSYGTSYCHRDHEKETVYWKLSPFTDCACKNNKKYKNYFNCCWPDLTWYQHDSDGNLFSLNRMVADDPITKLAMEGIAKLRDQAEERGGDGRVFPGMNRENNLKMFRSLPPEIFYATIRSADPGGISDIYNWDLDVYAGTMERIGNYFHWNDLHWAIAKSELLVRVKEWNTALSKYCDDHHLRGKERAEVIRIHTASPFARCANPSCTEVEVKVKQFKKCSRCNAVAYCSTNCQKEQWPTHRARCHKAP